MLCREHPFLLCLYQQMAVKLKQKRKQTILKKLILVFTAFAFASCGNSSSTEEESNTSTVDSNLAAPADPNLGLQNLDNPYADTSFEIAMDSAGPTIDPQDTNYTKK
jgi:hypothetical protein